MHTDPYDSAGNNLIEIAKSLNIIDNVKFSDSLVPTEKLNILYNIADVTINIAYSEGFGLTTLESMMAGKPIIVTQTGGLTRQVIDKDTLEEYGVAIMPEIVTIAGTQNVPYLNEDYVSVEKATKAILKIYEMSKEKRNVLGKSARIYAEKNFSYPSMIKSWNNSINDTILNWTSKYNRVRVEEI